MSRIITAAERAARRNNGAVPKQPAVIWRKKGCKSCKPVVVPLRHALS